ncbi:STAS domain-containing protein [Streptomyces sp. NBC_00091]|uniref:STAS domain-containing protein n=1 Tax=Streptomyces sp. NBC_00091 TaxID=2975648 RepID=UPI00225B42BE|nr:STAS domain-containing protein [Streptomyces sp. NBC_00091]MCX5376348.1 STAS domain-containing protein [Streptomyces sp. NBC_00091]
METRTLALEGPAPDTADLCARVRALCRDGPDELVCDARAVTEPTLATVDALARAALTARRHGTPFRVRADGPLRALLALAGLGEPLREPEQREPAVGVQEGVEPDDPPL